MIVEHVVNQICSIAQSHSNERTQVLIYGKKSKMNTYQTLLDDKNVDVHFAINNDKFNEALSNASGAVIALILQKQISSSLKSALVSACDRLRPFYAVRIHSELNIDNDTRKLSIIFDYDDSLVSRTFAALRVMTATKRAFQLDKLKDNIQTLNNTLRHEIVT